MTDVAIMLEGQQGLNWPRFQRLARHIEDLGFAGLYRSDHYTNPHKPDLDSLELWISLAWLASHTERIDFGPLVTPMSFRDPTMTARMAAAVDDLSGGRLWLGVGAGWQQREHHAYGWDLLSVPERFERLRDGLEVFTRLLQNDTHSTYTGRYYQIDDAILLPRPQRPGGPPILIGGNGVKRTLPLVVEYGTEWNAVLIDSQTYAARNERLTEMLDAAGRSPNDVGRSVMLGLVFGADDAALKRRLDDLGNGRTPDDLREHGMLVGTPAAIVDQIGAYSEGGAERLMLQWLALDDLDGLEAFASGVLGQL